MITAVFLSIKESPAGTGIDYLHLICSCMTKGSAFHKYVRLKICSD